MMEVISSAELTKHLKTIESKDEFVDIEIKGIKICNLPTIGGQYWFEYHCNESHDSGDAEIWYRSHQKVTVLEVDNECLFSTMEERCDSGHQLVYHVRFEDGLEWGVFEDELMTTKDNFCRPDPPKAPPS